LSWLHVLVLLAMRLVGEHGEVAVDLGAGDLFEQLGTLVRLRLQKRRELSLREQHGAHEALRNPVR
jgi:hypothetical protein